ncbi:hypothetical protein OIU79_013171 [Salix purpurea]|uniref:Uncharacterized protein n=1 Tax=Salix purpurea TaxID=77065 RepID=A0A9Q0Q4V2_SALPP|nr:hypothetical protein OIU79_013171 [Salix purpurea]
MLRKPSIDVIFPLVLLLLLIVENYVSSLISSISSSMGARWQQHSSLSLSCTTCYRLISQRLQPLSPSQTQTATFHRTAPLKAALILKVIKVLSLNDPHKLNKKATDFKPGNIKLLCWFNCRVWTSLH